MPFFIWPNSDPKGRNRWFFGVFEEEEHHIVPTFRLSPFQALSQFIRITSQKNCSHSLDFKLVPAYSKNGDNFFQEWFWYQEIKCNNETWMTKILLCWHQTVQTFYEWSENPKCWMYIFQVRPYLYHFKNSWTYPTCVIFWKTWTYCTIIIF